MPEVGWGALHQHQTDYSSRKLESFSLAIRTLLPYGICFPIEPKQELLSVHLDRHVEKLSSATEYYFQFKYLEFHSN